MNFETIEQVKSLMETYEKMIKLQNDVIREKEERIILLKRYIDIQEIEKEVSSLVNINQICLN